MVEPRIEYARTADGFSIGCTRMGEGLPVLMAPGDPLSQISLMWQVPPWLGFCQRLASSRQLVFYDGRGTGFSDPSESPPSLETGVSDLSGVADCMGLETFVLFAPLASGPAAIAYAASHPQRVAKLILWCSYARATAYFGSAAWRSLHDLMNTNWELFLQTVAHARFGPEAHQPEFDRSLKSGVTLPMMQDFLAGAEKTDVTHLLSQVTPETLVLHRRDLHMGPTIDEARRLASQIPNAQMVLLQGTSVAPYQGDFESVLIALSEFLGDAEINALADVDAFSENSIEPLSLREKQVLQLIAAGFSNKEIADELIVATGTVKTHINHLYGKLAVRSRTQALAKARELNLL